MRGAVVVVSVAAMALSSCGGGGEPDEAATQPTATATVTATQTVSVDPSPTVATLGDLEAACDVAEAAVNFRSGTVRPKSAEKQSAAADALADVAEGLSGEGRKVELAFYFLADALYKQAAVTAAEDVEPADFDAAMDDLDSYLDANEATLDASRDVKKFCPDL